MSDARTQRLALAILVLNTLLILFWVVFDWNSKRQAAKPIVPTNLAQVVGVGVSGALQG